MTGWLDFARRCVQRVVEVQIVDRGIALAALAFTALLPLSVVVASVTPRDDREALAEGIVDRFRLDDHTAAIVVGAFSPPVDSRVSISVGSALLVIGSALSFTRALQRVYERSWELPQLGVRATPAGLAWLVTIVLLGSVFRGAREAALASSRPAFSVAVALALSAALWLFTPWVLLSRRVTWRALLPTSVLTAVAMTTLSTVSVIYMPRSIAESADRYGPIGVSIALLSWLVAAGFVVVACAAIGAVLGRREDRALRSGSLQAG